MSYRPYSKMVCVETNPGATITRVLNVSRMQDTKHGQDLRRLNMFIHTELKCGSGSGSIKNDQRAKIVLGPRSVGQIEDLIGLLQEYVDDVKQTCDDETQPPDETE